MKSLEEITKFEDLAEELKSQEYWDKAINGLKERYEFNKYDKETALRLIFIIWYITREWGCIGYKNTDMYDLYLSRDIRKIYLETKDYFKDDLDYLLIVGYLMNFTSEYFVDDVSNFSEYSNKYEDLGKMMIKKAFEVNPQNIVSELIYREVSEKDYHQFHKNHEKEIEEGLKKFFENRGRMGDYFWCIFDGSEFA